MKHKALQNMHMLNRVDVYLSCSSSTQLIDIQPISNSNTNSVKSFDHGVVDSETTIISNMKEVIIASRASNVLTKDLNKKKSKLMGDAMKEDIDYMFKSNVIMRVPRSIPDSNCELQLLKWVLKIKRSLKDSSNTRFRARLVSAISMPYLRHSIARNTPTTAIRTVHLFFSCHAYSG